MIRLAKVIKSAEVEPGIATATFHKPHETEVHVELHVAMMQGETGFIGNEIDFDALPARHVDRVLENSYRRFFADSSQLKCMPVKVNRVIIAAPQLERIEAPDNADIPAKRRNSRRFIHVLLRAKAAAQN